MEATDGKNLTNPDSTIGIQFEYDENDSGNEKEGIILNEGDGVKSDDDIVLGPLQSSIEETGKALNSAELLKPFCYWGHEMVLKDEKECYECSLCDNKKEGEHWWCESCRDEPEDELNICSECVSDKVCSKGHPLVKDPKDFYRYYNCIYCKRYNIYQPSFYCYACEKAGCLSCCQEKNDEELGCLARFTRSKKIKCILSSFAVDLLRRLVPILQATWVQVDVFLDARQTWTYDYYRDPNGTYTKWAKEHMIKTNSTYEHTVSEGYFLTAMAIWLLTPILLALFVWISTQRSLLILRSFCFFEFRCENKFLKALLAILLFPIEIISAAVIIYLVIPYSSFKVACKILMRHEFKLNTEIVDPYGPAYIPMDPQWLPGWKGFEFIGEAIPQLTLSIVFMANNYEFMIDTETFIGAKEFDVTLTSMIFSIGSIGMGLFSGIPIIIDIF